LGDTTLGTDPNNGSGVFVGGEAVTLTYLGTAGNSNLAAFGAIFTYAPSFSSPAASTYQLALLNGAQTSVGNPGNLSTAGGTFFLGVIGTSATLFNAISLNSDEGDFLTPGYQISELDYGASAAVPLPGSLPLLAVGILGVFLIRVRKRSLLNSFT
jgi:hypothetical protein